MKNVGKTNKKGQKSGDADREGHVNSRKTESSGEQPGLAEAQLQSMGQKVYQESRNRRFDEKRKVF